MAFRGVLPAQTTQGTFQSQQDYKYNTVYPYGLPLPSNSNLDQVFKGQLHSTVRTADPFLKKVYNNKTQNEFENLFYPTQLNERITQMSQECRTGDLDNLILNQDKNRSIRCGWLYTPASNESIPTPRLSQGYLGIRDGPFKFLSPPPSERAEWFWNLEEAREKILTARCSALKSCENVGGANFKSCGFCTGIGQGIPVDSQGRPLYPRNDRKNCNNGRIVMHHSQCPIETATEQQIGPDGLTESGREPDVCAPRDGKLTKDCIMKIINDKGCDEKGSLYKSVEQSTNNNDYIDNLRSSTAFRLYNERSPDKLYMNFGISTKTQIENEVMNLAAIADSSNYPRESGLGASARDLCLRSGDINAWDPCLEIPASAKAPYDLACLQSNFKKLGGQPAGKKYPNETTKIQIYDKMSTYGDIRVFWNKLLALTRSTDYSIQRQAMNDLYGIDPTLPQEKACSNWKMTTNSYFTSGTPCFNPNGNISCFSNKTIEEAKEECCNNPQCAGFSVVAGSDGKIGGCFKRSATCFVNSTGINGFYKA